MKGDSGYSVLDIDAHSRQHPIPNIQYPIPAKSIGLTLPLTPSPLRILSLHRQVCNFISDQGDLIALVHPSLGNGPFHIVLARPVSFATLKVGERVQWQGDNLIMPGLSIDLAQAQVWESSIDWPPLPPHQEAWNCLREYVRKADLSGSQPAVARNLTGLHAAMAERAQKAAEHLLAGLRTGRESDIIRATEQLAGLGPGLTPAGDDFLLGFMARIWLEPALLPPGWTAPDLCQLIAQTAGPRTTILSRIWLDYAARGQFAEPWHDLVAALAANEQPSIHHATDRILNIGATSGRDALSGFLLLSE